MDGQLALKTEYSLKDWVQIHFGNSTYNGHVVIGARKAGQASIYRFRSISVNELEEKITKLKFKNMDYYITANSFAGLDRNRDALFGLENIVVDIDYHTGAISKLEHFNKSQKLLSRIQEQMGDLLPNSICRTGRGLQLWWSVSSIHKTFEATYYQVLDHIIDRINCIIREDQELYDYFGFVDAAPSHNLAGFFRMPGSYNTKSKTYGYIEIWHNRKIDLSGEIIEKKKPAEVLPMPASFDTWKLAKKRIFQMEQLRSIRMAAEKREQRDLMNLIVYCSCAGAYEDKVLEDIVNRFNQGHRHPMPERELWQQLSTAKKKKYKLSNQWIIRSLEITEEEQEKIGIRASGSISEREIERMKAREKKKKRNEKILTLALEGFTYKEISELVNCSEKTISRVINKAGVKKTWFDLHTQICEMEASGFSKEESAELLGVCVRTVERHIASNQDRNMENEEDKACPRKTPGKGLHEATIIEFVKNGQVLDPDPEKMVVKNDKVDKTASIYLFSIGERGASINIYSPPPPENAKYDAGCSDYFEDS